MSSISKQILKIMKDYDLPSTPIVDNFRELISNSDNAILHLKAQQNFFDNTLSGTDTWNMWQDRIELIESFVEEGRKLLNGRKG